MVRLGVNRISMDAYYGPHVCKEMVARFIQLGFRYWPADMPAIFARAALAGARSEEEKP